MTMLEILSLSCAGRQPPIEGGEANVCRHFPFGIVRLLNLVRVGRRIGLCLFQLLFS
jgi:hypothetical protein